jgi:uncharacterized protein with HEPN domain
MLPSLLDFLRHIEHECVFVIKASKNKTLHDITEDELLGKAIVRSLEIIGEATKRLPSDFRHIYQQIPWEEMAGMRDVLIHNYFGVDYEVVWNTINKDIPDLLHEIQRIIKVESKN